MFFAPDLTTLGLQPKGNTRNSSHVKHAGTSYERHQSDLLRLRTVMKMPEEVTNTIFGRWHAIVEAAQRAGIDQEFEPHQWPDIAGELFKIATAKPPEDEKGLQSMVMDSLKPVTKVLSAIIFTAVHGIAVDRNGISTDTKLISIYQPPTRHQSNNALIAHM